MDSFWFHRGWLLPSKILKSHTHSIPFHTIIHARVRGQNICSIINVNFEFMRKYDVHQIYFVFPTSLIQILSLLIDSTLFCIVRIEFCSRTDSKSKFWRKKQGSEANTKAVPLISSLFFQFSFVKQTAGEHKVLTNLKS